MIDNFSDKTNFPCKLILTDRQVSNLCKAFANNSSANKKLSKTQISKIKQSGGFLGKLLKPLMKTGFPFMKNELTPLAKSVIVPLGLTASASATYAAFQKKIFESGMTKLLISNDKMEDVMKIIKSLDESGILIKCVTKTIENETKKQIVGFLAIFSGTVGASLLGNIFAGKSVIRAGEEADSQRFYQNEPNLMVVIQEITCPIANLRMGHMQ